MGRKIILLPDGTGNSAAKVWRTNVWRVFESLDLSGSDQVAFYDDGVGTSSFKPLAILGGAFGFGLKRNVVDLYKFASRNYRNNDDEIYGFGFSRGAFTIRIVIGLILEQGLIKAESEKDLHAKAEAAYRAFRDANFHTNWYYALRWALNHFGKKAAPEDKKHFNINVGFLGLWDTVAAYGTPVDEMTRGISQWIWPWQLPSYHLGGPIRRACHALSIDDERTTFHPILWDESDEEPLQPRGDEKRYLADERISQVWFAGVHSNVGGGYPDDSIAQIPLIWIMSEAQGLWIAPQIKGRGQPSNFLAPRHCPGQRWPHLRSPAGAGRLLPIWAARPLSARQGLVVSQGQSNASENSPERLRANSQQRPTIRAERTAGAIRSGNGRRTGASAGRTGSEPGKTLRNAGPSQGTPPYSGKGMEHDLVATDRLFHDRRGLNLFGHLSRPQGVA